MNEYRLIYELNQRSVVFNIFGDTNQLMKPGRGISDWSEVRKALQADQFTLNENYRNTNQITRFCNSSFDMNVSQTGVDGANVREISRRDLEKELAALNVGNERIAILVPRGVQKDKYIDKEILPESISEIIGDKMDNGYIALMYVDEVKGIEFDRAYVVVNKMSRNEKYIAYTRALSELILIVDDQVADYDDGSSQDVTEKKTKAPAKKKKKSPGVINYTSPSEKGKQDSRTKETTGRTSDETVEEKTSSDTIKTSDSNTADATETKFEVTEKLDSAETQEAISEVVPDPTPKIAPALKELPRGYIEVSASGTLEGIYYLVPYNGKVRNYTVKKTTAMFIPQVKAGKEVMVPVSVVEEDRIIFISKDLYKIYKKSMKIGAELKLIRQETP